MINEYGRNRGKFKKGSNKNPVTNTGGRTKKPEAPAEDQAEEAPVEATEKESAEESEQD